jgi:ABC-2 type transport system ATP-binding protein
MAAFALELKDVRKCYGRRVALDGLNLAVPVGSVCGLVGSNGAGKTTAMAVTMSLVMHQGGTVNVLGDGPFDATKHAGRVSFMPQDSLMPPYAKIVEILSFYASLQGIPHRHVRNEVDRVIELVHLSDRATSRVHTLSHGMRRRVAIAQSLLGAPDLILMDEPTSGLDPGETQHLREVMRNKQSGATIVISSHILSELERMCDCIAFIEKGKTVLQDSMDAVTCRSSMLHYRLKPGTLPLDELRRLLPGVIFESADNGVSLICHYQPAAYQVENVNRQILKTLLTADIGIIEIHTGSGLEKANLDRK